MQVTEQISRTAERMAPGRAIVACLRANGVDTDCSCQGGPTPVPTMPAPAADPPADDALHAVRSVDMLEPHQPNGTDHSQNRRQNGSFRLPDWLDQ